MASPHERNDARKGRKFRPKPQGRRRTAAPAPASDDWIWGWHAVEAALANPAPRRRRCACVATPERGQADRGEVRPPARAWRSPTTTQIGQSLPQGAVHQGVALRPAPLEDVDLADFEAGPARWS